MLGFAALTFLTQAARILDVPFRAYALVGGVALVLVVGVWGWLWRAERRAISTHDGRLLLGLLALGLLGAVLASIYHLPDSDDYMMTPDAVHFIEAPIEVMERRSGKSTINTMTAVDTLIEIVNVLMWFKPLKFFVPLAVAVGVAGVLWAIPFLVMGRGLSSISLLLLLAAMMIGMLGLLAEQMASSRRVDMPEVEAQQIRGTPDEASALQPAPDDAAKKEG